MKARLKELKAQLRERMHDAIPEQGKWLKAVVTGYFAYHGAYEFPGTGGIPVPRHRPMASHAQTSKSETRYDVGPDHEDRRCMATPTRILHPWPDRRFAVKHPRWEPSA